jgi:hypothetical protein
VHFSDLLEQIQLHLSVSWVFQGETADHNPERAPREGGTVAPPVQRLLALREHARIGYSKGVQRELDAIAALDPLYLPYVARLREPAKEFRMKEIVTIIEETLHDEYSEV